MRADVLSKIINLESQDRYFMYKKKFGKLVIASLMAAALTVTPVFAAPTVNELEQKKAEEQNKVSALQAELTELLTKMGDLEADLIEKGTEVTQATTDLEVAQKKEEKQYEDMKLRIKYMYEEGDATFVEKLLTADSISELLNQADFVQSVHSYDRKMLQEYVDTKEQIADLKETLETEMANMEKMQENYEAEKQNLNTTIETHRANVADFDAQLQAAVQAAAEAAAQREAELRAAVNQITSEQNNNGTSSQNNENGSSQNNGNAGSQNNGNAGGQNNGGNNVAPPQQGGSNNTTGGTDQGNVDQTPSVPQTPQQPEQPQEPVAPPVGDTSVGQAIVNVAYGYLGIPYVWGGTTTAGFDCSGMVQAAHAAVGISLPRVSEAQGACGQPVGSMAEALPGDIVCYGYHVGIYIGGGQMIHAPEPGDVVKVSSVYGSPWFRRCW